VINRVANTDRLGICRRLDGFLTPGLKEMRADADHCPSALHCLRDLFS